MRLLIVTQVVDSDHPILGFFHRWIEEFARQGSVTHVIGLAVGNNTLRMDGIFVHSLGKEIQPVASWRYAWRLIVLSWKLRQEYDAVFVHMNPEYILSAGWLWRLLGKRILFWYAHGTVSVRLRFAAMFAHALYTSTPEGLRLASKKLHVVGQGIDTELFKPENIPPTGEPVRIVTVGRIAPSKRIETLIRAVQLLSSESLHCHLTIVGNANTASEVQYRTMLEEYVRSNNLAESIHFAGAVPQRRLPDFLRRAVFFISDGATGSLDKVLVEASACGCIVISSNDAFVRTVGMQLPEVVFGRGDYTALATRIRNLAFNDVSTIRTVEQKLLVKPNTISGLIRNILECS